MSKYKVGDRVIGNEISSFCHRWIGTVLKTENKLIKLVLVPSGDRIWVNEDYFDLTDQGEAKGESL